MNFAVTADDVRSAFGLTGVVHFPRYNAPHNQLNDRTALFLSSIGLPDTEWFMSKASLRTDDPINLVSWYGARGTVPASCRHWLVLGLFADTTLALDPDQGTVYALGEGEEELVYHPIHRDVESLVYALTKFEALRRQLENDDEETEERVDALRGEITEFDPLPFADEDSQWHLAFEEVIDGIW
ncbi:SUKH-4 family immunity protein [Streptomyces microflavus]|uniref:SUKH-4 family immunity protein n=1 Tax=Streptomyces microflavus TaxID=1919 RepID=UPI0029A9BF96|nr:SUKH-4 family immunity protein [Streptomyces microflavus]MDX2407321.1 SUKH-4 family immunity protein [Streptomyces microflavus]